jgi:hypothetical protein
VIELTTSLKGLLSHPQTELTSSQKDAIAAHAYQQALEEAKLGSLAWCVDNCPQTIMKRAAEILESWLKGEK